MTAPATTRRAGPFNGNGAATSFPFTFKVFATSDVAVIKTSTTGVESTLTLGSDYSITLNPDQDASPGGSITYPISGAALATGEKLTAIGAIPYDQTADLPTGGSYRAVVVENALDRTVFQVQQLAEELGRSLTLPASAATADTELPAPEAGKVIAWNSTGTALVNVDSGDLASVVVAGTSYTDLFSGTGAQTAFTLTADPGSVNALDVAISGVSQVNGVDFTVSGTTLTFTSAPPAGTSNIAARYIAALPQDGALGALASTSSGRGASLVNLASTFTDEVTMHVTDAINGQPQISVLRFMTSAQRADYLARTAVSDFANALDLTAPIQTAIYVTYAAGVWLYFPDGAAKVTGLEGPTTTALYEDRGDTWCMVGAGGAQPFVRYPAGGAVLISETDAPVFRYRQRRSMPTAGGNTQIRGLRFEQRNAAATSPVVLWDSMSENAEFSENVLVQFGTGHGFEVTYQIKGNIERNFALYGGYFTATMSAAGIGFNIPSAADAGMLTVRKNSARSFFWGYVHGDGTNDSSGALFQQNECSDCVNGIWNKAGCTGATIDKTYTEGITGTCVMDEGNMTTITGGMHYLGFTTGIDASDTSNYGTLIEGNYLETAGPGCTLIEVGSGGPNKTVRGNHLLFSTSGGSVTNVIGIEITGLNPRLDVSANAFLPRGAWVGGAGTIKILNSAAGGLIGALPLPSGADLEIPSLLRGAVTYQQAASALTQADVNGSNVLALPDTNSVLASASAGCVVTSLSQSSTFTDGVREVSIRTTTSNMSFQDSANLELAGGVAFTGPGILVLQVEVIGGTVYGYEKSRTVF